jgi:RNA polymerase sigma-B factor
MDDGVDADEAALFARRQQPEERRILVEMHDELAQRLARRFRGRGVAIDDLIQVARFGLLNAIDRFDPERGIKFTTFAGRTIIGELKHHFRDQSWSVRAPRSLQNLWLETSRAVDHLSQRLLRSPTIAEIADYLDVEEERVLEALDAGGAYTAASLDQPVAGDADTSVGDLIGDLDPAMQHSEARSTLADHIRSLPQRERTIVYLRFFEGRTQSEIAAEVGVSQVHVSRLLTKTLDDLREAIAGGGDD